jgi:hypothetical protein
MEVIDQEKNNNDEFIIDPLTAPTSLYAPETSPIINNIVVDGGNNINPAKKKRKKEVENLKLGRGMF